MAQSVNPNKVLKDLSPAIRIVPRKYRTIISLIIIGIVVVVAIVLPSLNPQNDSDPSRSPDPPVGMYQVARVVDGDTFAVRVGSEEQAVRLIGVDTPEVVDPRKPVQCFGQEASAKMKAMLHNQNVKLEVDPSQDNADQYGRWLRYVYLADGTNVNLALIEQGYAHEYTFRIPYAQQVEFKAAQQQARDQELGLWNPGSCPQ